ncbi:ABC transporter permease [Anaerovorax odorimutans]|uniref:ABC transporter permease n=1 Tax=Anaerovorax odorimutans TaxID=109327 RepID=UPI000409A442|nr:ABC transporter permease [Anaerovorax odorimutans]
MKKVRFIIKRIAQVIPMLFIVSVLAFTLSNLSAGDAAAITLRGDGVEVTKENLEAVRSEFGLDKSLPEQYLNWLKKVVKFDFGTSFQTKKPVINEIARRFPTTLKLAITATFFSLLLAIPIALISARYQNRLPDHIFRLLCTALATMPDYWVGLMLMFVFAVLLKIFPVISGSEMKNIFLPAITLSLAPMATYVRLLRNNLVEIKGFEYMKAARAKGLSETMALIKHGLKNAMVPCLTMLGTNFGILVSGSFAIETIFSWNGIGKFAVESIKLKDFPVIQCYIMVVAFTYIMLNLALDIIYVFIDPKIQLD